MLDQVIKAIEGSPVWEDINKRVKALYEAEGRRPSEEEYQAVRNMIICKTMLEDPQVKELMAKYTYEQLQQA